MDTSVMTEVSCIFDVNAAKFETRVVDQSHHIPVLVDFWASWCAPCQMLTPLLAKIVDEYQGAVLLAKVNTDVEKELAARYQVRSLPTVVLFKNGQIVDHFMGAQQESVIKRMIDPHIQRKSDAELERAATLLEAGNNLKAKSILTSALDKYPTDDRLKLKLAEVYLENKDLQQAKHILSEASLDAKNSDPYKILQSRIEFWDRDDTSVTLDDLVAQLTRQPDDLASRHKLAIRYVITGDLEKAMAEFLEIVKRDRSFQEDAGRKDLLRVFDMLGGKGELVNRYRALLARALN
jgi:putative thioredoxin